MWLSSPIFPSLLTSLKFTASMSIEVLYISQLIFQTFDFEKEHLLPANSVMPLKRQKKQSKL